MSNSFEKPKLIGSRDLEERKIIFHLRSLFHVLTSYYSNAHISLEEDGGKNYKVPMWYLNIVYPLIAYASGVLIFMHLFYLGD